MIFLNSNWFNVGCSDPDVIDFINATGITDATIISAVCTLTTSLKNNGLWNKMNAIYPMVGGSGFSHKFNLKNATDTNPAFRLLFSGGWVHSSGGALPNGVNAYANTLFNPLANSLQNSHHLSYYSRTNSNLSEVEMGSFNTSSNGSLIEIRTGNISYFRINNGVGSITFADTDSRAFYISNRTASNLINAWRNSTKSVQSTTLISTTLSNVNYFIGAFSNSGVGNFYSRKQCAFASIGTGLTDTEAINFYNIVQAFQTTLGRNV
jgi:hypothetical protein